MSSVQSSASRGGEFTDWAVTSGRNCLDLASQLEKHSAVTKPVAFSWWLEPPFASGSDSGAVFFGDVTQQVLFAQQPGLQAFSLATFERMHDRAESGVAAMGSTIATMSDMTSLLTIALTS
jgi:hypothetical protein